jgi:hypothetical protein
VTTLAVTRALRHPGGMKGSPLDQRLAPYTARKRAGVSRASFDRVHLRGLQPRLSARLDEAVAIFELDRFLYDIEVDAQHAWLRNLMAFDAYCARRAARIGRAGDKPVR